MGMDDLHYMERAFGTHEALYRAQVLAATWGHLEPKRNRYYDCTVVFCMTECGDYEVIRSDFGPDLGGSPGLQSDLTDFAVNEIDRWEANHKDKEDGARGRIFKFVGTYVRKRNGEPVWEGRVSEVEC